MYITPTVFRNLPIMNTPWISWSCIIQNICLTPFTVLCFRNRNAASFLFKQHLIYLITISGDLGNLLLGSSSLPLRLWIRTTRVTNPGMNHMVFFLRAASSQLCESILSCGCEFKSFLTAGGNYHGNWNISPAILSQSLLEKYNPTISADKFSSVVYFVFDCF
jgi:hypothetical protein